ncbi:DUF748 domain-containing protein [Lyngbya confervoides]|uniref:AsmA domain-containing protein n=1 Tax=Lyngbya confervoides BDU141951 TaxID=1574623 RepID=A0ABD4T0B7_9CYAN|nr:hypothetical protein [Lyngbya confervoides]MCM1981883.1 hypothetical protein [Lyngbya confervoides BDU141951]
MKRLTKILMFLGLGFLITLVIAWFRLEAIAHQALEENLTRVLGVPVHIERLQLQQLAGKAQFDNLEIDNPEGYSANKIVAVQQIDVAFDPWSLFQSTIKIDRLVFQNIRASFEQTLEGNNILEIVNHVKGRSQSWRIQTPTTAQFNFQDKRFEINQANLKDIQVNVNLNPLGGLIPFGNFSPELEFSIPDIELKQVTSENAQTVLEGTLNDIISDLLSRLAGGITTELPNKMNGAGSKGVIDKVLDVLPF